MKHKFDILFEDNHLLVVNKPAGMLVQGDKTGDACLLEYAKDYIKKKYKKPGNVYLGLVHRLDRPVSGIVVLAKTSKALERLSVDFRDRKVKKYYWAITNSKPQNEKGHLAHWLKKDTSRNVVKASKKESKGGLKAELNYDFIGRIGGNYLVEVNLITGRFHQIRVQLSTMGCSILGDVKYGGTKAKNDGSIFLHARKIILNHPVKKEDMTFTAPIPAVPIWQNFKEF